MSSANRLLAMAVATAMAWGTAQTAANATAISVFNDVAFVDTSREGQNLIDDLMTLGHTVSTFTGTTGAAWQAGIGANWILVLPEMENGNLQSSLSAAAQTEIQNFVNMGGLLVQANYFSDNADLPNALFGWSLVQSSADDLPLNAGNAAGTPYAGGPAILPDSNAVETVLTASLPGGALSIYDDGTDTSVFLAQLGLGHYAYLGFDWFEDPTPAEWLEVLERTLALHQQQQAVPAPGTLALFGLGLAGLGALRRRKAA